MKSIIRNSSIFIYLKYLRWKYFPSRTQLIDKRLSESRVLFYSQFLEKGDLCFDIGANVGNRTEIFLALGATVVAVEPQPVCVKMISMKFGKKVHLIQEGLGAKQGEGDLYLSNTPELSSLSTSWIDSVSRVRFKNVIWGKKLKIKINTLDNLIAKFGVPKFCKIDVEGYEEHVFQGLSKKIPLLSFEYTIPERIESIQQCFNQLSKIGAFDSNFTIGENMEFQFSDWVSAEKLLARLRTASKSALFGDIYIRFKN